MDWVTALNQALDVIEANLTASVDPQELAKIACCSVFHFQRIFSCLAGVPLSEYVRRRRMTLAAAELSRGAKVLDTALKYGYESPTAFNRAFQAVHGLTPSQAQRQGTRLSSYPPIRFRISIQGVTEMKYRIENKDAFTVLGMERTFTMEGGENFALIPKFWDEFFANGYDATVTGQMGVCLEDTPTGNTFRYLIADPCQPDAPVPDGFVKETLPALTWAIFEGKGPLPHALQTLNRRIFEEWLPASTEYTLSAGCNIELYTCGDTQSAEYAFEIWLPVKAKE